MKLYATAQASWRVYKPCSALEVPTSSVFLYNANAFREQKRRKEKFGQYSVNASCVGTLLHQGSLGFFSSYMTLRGVSHSRVD